MIPKKAGMEPNEIPTTIFYRLVYEPPIFTETVVHHPKEPNFAVNGGNDLPPFKYHGSRIQVLEEDITTLHQPLGHLAVKKPAFLGQFDDQRPLLPKFIHELLELV